MGSYVTLLESQKEYHDGGDDKEKGSRACPSDGEPRPKPWLNSVTYQRNEFWSLHEPEPPTNMDSM